MLSKQFVAKCFGSFHVMIESFQTVGLSMDYSCSGLKGNLDVDPSIFTLRTRKEIGEMVLKSIRLVYERGVYLTDIEFQNFFLVANGHTSKMHDFSFTQFVEDIDAGQCRPRVNAYGVKYMLDEAGF